MDTDFLDDLHADMVAQTDSLITDMNQVAATGISGLDPRQCNGPTSGRYCHPVSPRCYLCLLAPHHSAPTRRNGPTVRIARLSKARIETLPEGRSLLAHTPCRPQPLLDLLDARGYRVIVIESAAGDAWVQIFSPDDSTGR